MNITPVFSNTGEKKIKKKKKLESENMFVRPLDIYLKKKKAFTKN